MTKTDEITVYVKCDLPLYRRLEVEREHEQRASKLGALPLRAIVQKLLSEALDARKEARASR